MARIDWVEQRLKIWSLWLATQGSGVLGYAKVKLTDADAGRDGYASAAIPISDVEASETNDAVQRLPSELKATTLEVYTGPGGIRDKLKRLHCSEPTLHRRIDQAHRLLADHFMAREDRQRCERERVETLQNSVRP